MMRGTFIVPLMPLSLSRVQALYLAQIRHQGWPESADMPPGGTYGGEATRGFGLVLRTCSYSEAGVFIGVTL